MSLLVAVRQGASFAEGWISAAYLVVDFLLCVFSHINEDSPCYIAQCLEW